MSADHIPDAGPAVTDVGKLIQAPLVGRLVEALKRISAMTPGAANAVDARALHLTVKAIADEALDHIPDAGNMIAPVEAVAWRFWHEGGWNFSITDPSPHLADCVERDALYTHPAPIKPSADTGELRERVARLIGAADGVRWDGRTVTYVNAGADDEGPTERYFRAAEAILDLIQSERLTA